MPNKYLLSKRADKDIEKILEYSYQNFGTNQALKYKNGLIDSLELLAQNPNLGRKCFFIKAEYFRFEYQSHIIFYKQKKECVFIVRLIHKSMDIDHQLLP